MNFIVANDLQECIDLCKQLEQQILEHKEDTARVMKGEAFEQYAKIAMHTSELVKELKSILNKLHNEKIAM